MLTPQWKGGLYYAVQSRKARTPEEQAATSSVALLYLSAWRSEAAATEGAAANGAVPTTDGAADSPPAQPTSRSGTRRHPRARGCARY